MKGAIVYCVTWTEFDQSKEHFQLHESKEAANKHYTQLVHLGFPNVRIWQPLSIEKGEEKTCM